MPSLSTRLKYSLIGAAILAPMLFSYFYGPKSELTLLARLHYNTLFVYTPCLGRMQSYDDGIVRFNYRRPPALLSHTAVLFVTPGHNRTADILQEATEVVNLELPFGPAYKLKFKSELPALPTPVRTMKVRGGTGEIRPGVSTFKDYGPEYLYLTLKNGYIYKIELPFYLERIVDRSWIFPALYHTGILTWLMPGAFADYLPPRGFWEWFFTPCADKQMYCSGKTMMESIELVN